MNKVMVTFTVTRLLNLIQNSHSI